MTLFVTNTLIPISLPKNVHFPCLGLKNSITNNKTYLHKPDKKYRGQQIFNKIFYHCHY